MLCILWSSQLKGFYHTSKARRLLHVMFILLCLIVCRRLHGYFCKTGCFCPKIAQNRGMRNRAHALPDNSAVLHAIG